MAIRCGDHITETRRPIANSWLTRAAKGVAPARNRGVKTIIAKSNTKAVDAWIVLPCPFGRVLADNLGISGRGRRFNGKQASRS